MPQPCIAALDYISYVEWSGKAYMCPGARTSSIFKIILTSCVARLICCFLPISVSMTFCFFMSAQTHEWRVEKSGKGRVRGWAVFKEEADNGHAIATPRVCRGCWCVMRTVGALFQAVHAQEAIALPELLRLDGCHRLDGGQARVLCQRHGDGLHGLCECMHGVLLQRRHLVRLL